MITNINISGFKSFVNKDIPLRNITLLTGLNSSGKSSVIQALRMYHLAYQGLEPWLHGHGGIRELCSKFVGPKENINISIVFGEGNEWRIQLSSATH